MKIKELLININNVPAGYLTKEETGVGQNKYVFTYLPNVSKNEAVSVTMPVRKESYVTFFMHPVFEMSQPEGLLKDYLKNRFSKMLTMDDMGLLFLTGQSRIGAVTAEIDLNNEDDEELIKIAELVNSQNDSKEMTDDEILHPENENWDSLFKRLLEDFALKSGVGGMQPKVLAELITFNSPTHIVKSSENDLPFLSLNESLCLKVAEESGLTVPNHRISDNGQVIIIDRFDIAEDNSRLGFEDGCVLQALPADSKYESSLEKLASSILTYVSPHQKNKTAEELFKLVVINALVRNGDAHLKNFAITYNGDIALSSVYDITTTRAYIKFRDDVPALMMQNTRRWPTKKELVRFGQECCLLKAKDCQNAIEQVVKAVESVGQTIPEFIDQYPGSEIICVAMVNQWNDAIKSLEFKKERGKQKIETCLDGVERSLIEKYGKPYELQDKPVKTLRTENSLNL